MEVIFHEQQEGSLCAQHCLNALLQGQYFSPVDLADLAKQLDETEREQMAVAGLQTAEYQKFLQEPSNNLDDSGFFSIQVIDKALSVWGLGLIIFTSPDPVAVGARRDPVQQRAYICNFRGHWLTIRKIGYQWFNLNSLLTGPELISDTYLSLFLIQLQEEGYSIFIVTGDLPECEADIVLRLAPAIQPVKPRLINENAAISSSNKQEDMDIEEDSQLQKALAESRRFDENDDQALQRALEMSMEGYIWEPESPSEGQPPIPGPSRITTLERSEVTEGQNSSQSAKEAKSPNNEDLRQKRLAYLSKSEKICDKQTDTDKDSAISNNSCETQNKNKSAKQCLSSETTNHAPADNEQVSETAGEELSEEEMLKQAIEMSMSGDVK